MRRQWDRHREFKPRYKAAAGFCFWPFGRTWPVCRWGELGELLWQCTVHLINNLIALLICLVLVALSPILFPAMCVYERRIVRRRRLDWIRRNRWIDSQLLRGE